MFLIGFNTTEQKNKTVTFKDQGANVYFDLAGQARGNGNQESNFARPAVQGSLYDELHRATGTGQTVRVDRVNDPRKANSVQED